MPPSLGTGVRRRLEGLCADTDWVRSSGPVEGVELLEARLSGRPYARHRHDTYGIGVTDAGVQAFDYRGRSERSGPGQAWVLHPDELHDGRAATNGRFRYRTIYVDPARIATAVSVITGRPAALPFVREPVIDNQRLAHTVAQAFSSALQPLAVDDLVVRLADGLLEAAGDAAERGPQRVDRAGLQRSHEFLRSRRTVVSSTELERISGLSRYALARQFRWVYGISPYRYSVLQRLEFARQQLRDKGAALVDAAFAAGFADQAHFTRMFRSAYGVTPGRYLELVTAGRRAEAPSQPVRRPR